MFALAAPSTTVWYSAGVVNIHDVWQVLRLCANSSVHSNTGMSKQVITKAHSQWYSEGQNLKAKANASTLKAKTKAWTFEADANAVGPDGKTKTVMHTARAEIKIRSTSNTLIR